MSSSGSLSRFVPIHLGEAEDQRCQLVEPEGQVLEHAVPLFKQPCATVSANRLEQAVDVSRSGSGLREKTFGQQPEKCETPSPFPGNGVSPIPSHNAQIVLQMTSCRRDRNLLQPVAYSPRASTRALHILSAALPSHLGGTENAFRSLSTHSL